MPTVLNDFALCSLQELLNTQAENRLWQKELRLKSNALVNSRLAKVISQEEYQQERRSAEHEVAECRRRAGMLIDAINNLHEPLLVR